MTGSLDVTDIDKIGERGDPKPRDRSAASIEREMIAGAFVIPPGT